MAFGLFKDGKVKGGFSWRNRNGIFLDFEGAFENTYHARRQGERGYFALGFVQLTGKSRVSACFIIIVSAWMTTHLWLTADPQERQVARHDLFLL